jgi:hypothetical protein
MAGKVGSSSFSVFLVDGYNLLAAKLQGITHKVESHMEKSDGLGDAWEASSPTGVQTATLAQTGAFFDDSTNNIHAALSASEGVSRTVAFAFAGNVIGKPFVGLQGVYGQAYDVLAQNAALTKANVGYTVSGSLDRGVIVQDWVAKTVDWNTKTDGSPVDFVLDTSQTVIPIASIATGNPAPVTTTVPHNLTSGQKVTISGTTTTPSVNSDLVATVTGTNTFTVPINVTVGQAGAAGSLVRSNTVNGGAGYLEVSAFSGFTGFIGKIRSSADDITYADLVTFTNVTSAPTAQRVTVAGTVDRYLSFNGDVTGTGSITVFAGFSRT